MTLRIVHCCQVVQELHDSQYDFNQNCKSCVWLKVRVCVCVCLPDVDVQSPDEKSVITYVSTLYDVFPKVPEGGEGISANVST